MTENQSTAGLPTAGIIEETHFGGRRVKCYSERPRSLDAMFRAAVARDPAREAVTCGALRLTYGQLDGAVDTLCGNFARLGLKPGDRVALLLGNRVEFLAALLASARLGAVAVPINVREQKPELRHILADCGATLLIHDDHMAERLPSADEAPALRWRFTIGGPAEGSVPYDQLTAAAPPAPAVACDEEDVAVILYTSGTTGRPKGAMLTHLNLCHSALHFVRCMDLGDGDSSVLAVPASHVTGLVAILLTMIQAGGCSHMMPQFKAAEFLALAARERITHTVMVPAMYNLCLLNPDFARHDLSAWRIGAFGGAPMPMATISALAETVPGLTLMNCYGATETSSPATIMPPGMGNSHPDSVGRAVPCGQLRIVDAEGRDLPPGEVGEIWIGGPMVVPGYWNNEQATRQSFTDGFWHSGDVGSLSADGYLRILDRIKDMINRGGYKIYSAEVENVLAHHPGVIEAAAVPRPDPVLGEKVHAFVQRRDPAVTEEELRRFCAERLADYKVPDFFTLSDEPLPRNANGKLVKRSLRDMIPNPS